MAIGAKVRRLFGRHERTVARLYRSIFIDVGRLSSLICEWMPQARQILEVGCGEGAITEQLARLYPNANITAIDITPCVGRLFNGNRDRVQFVEMTVQAIAAAKPGQFDLVILSDVLHHVPIPLREELLTAVHLTLSSGGRLFFKDWERRLTPIHWLGYLSDRWITGDRIHYMRKQEAAELIAKTFGADSIIAEARVRPWNNNFAFLVQQ
jgi:2-polyprenyl-3-methyl-5-hydroxy-6-metoxy-1,4-benzoquinol methylase